MKVQVVNVRVQFQKVLTWTKLMNLHKLLSFNDCHLVSRKHRLVKRYPSQRVQLTVKVRSAGKVSSIFYSKKNLVDKAFISEEISLSKF